MTGERQAMNMHATNNRPRKTLAFIAGCLVTLLMINPALGQSPYYPTAGQWQQAEAASEGFAPEKLQQALQLANDRTVVEPHDMSQFIVNGFGREPRFSIVGPTKRREGGSGVVIKNGYVVAQWGDVDREDMTFSVTKSYLSSVAGLAYDDGLIPDLDEPVKVKFADQSFDDPHNASITWKHFLHQTSDWRGTLWGKPDWADRPANFDPKIAINRELHAPGTFYKYNDTRVNMLAYSLLNLWQRPLDGLLKERIMDPIGASNEWQWHGYLNSWVEINGQRMQSPSGGAHWGGGFFISTMDHARLGYLFLRNGNWNGEQLLSKEWIDQARIPSPINSRYGYMWWLNTDGNVTDNAPSSAFYASGAGGNYIWVDQENDLLIVMRWVPRLGEVMRAFYEALN